MKKSLIISTILLSCSLFSNELTWVDEQVEAIKPPRQGMSSNALSQMQDPFVFLNKDQEKKITPQVKPQVTSTPLEKPVKKEQDLVLSLILNNSVMINNAWYKKGDKVNGYEITKITSKSVLLSKKKKNLLLSTRSSSKNLKFNNK